MRPARLFAARRFDLEMRGYLSRLTSGGWPGIFVLPMLQRGEELGWEETPPGLTATSRVHPASRMVACRGDAADPYTLGKWARLE